VIRRARAALALFALLLAASPAAAVVDVHADREALWRAQPPQGPQDLKRLKEAAVARESQTRAKELEKVETWMKQNGFTPPVASGTPPGRAGGSGVLTDIDHTYASLADLQGAARRFEEMGYAVHWETPDSFSVRGLDYTGFSAQLPPLRHGTAAELDFERKATKFVDKLWTHGGQEWVRNRVVPDAALPALAKQKASLLEDLARVRSGALSPTERPGLLETLAKTDREIARLEAAQKVALTDATGFVVDMWKKGFHHTDPSHWCPPSAGFKCWEEPRQAAKAAARVLKEMGGDPARLKRLDDLAKGNQFLPGDRAAFEAQARQLRAEIRQTFKDGYDRALQADARHVRETTAKLKGELEAARTAGDVRRTDEALERIAAFTRGRREAASRIASTLDGIRTQPDGIEKLYEGLTGTALQKVSTPGGGVSYVTSAGQRLTANEVREVGAQVIKREVVRSWELTPEGLPQVRSRASFQEPQGTLGGIGKLEWAALGATAVMNAAEAVETVGKTPGTDVLAWSDIRRGNITAAKVKGWAWTVAVGTALTIGDLSGFRAGWQAGTAAQQPARPGEPPPSALWAATVGIGTVLGGGVGRSVYDSAEAAEIEAAAREGRAATRLGVLKNVVQNVTGQWLTDPNSEWWKQKRADIGGWVQALATEQAAQFEQWRKARGLEDRLGQGGLDQLLAQADELREFTTQLRGVWDSGVDLLHREIAAQERMTVLLERIETPDPSARCRELVAGLGPNPARMSMGYAHDKWLAFVEDREERVRTALEAAYEAYGAAAGYRGTLEAALSMSGSLAQQRAIRNDLDGRLRRLALALPGDPHVPVLQKEIAGFKDPIPVEQIPERLKDASSMLTTIESAVARLLRVAGASPECASLNPLRRVPMLVGLPLQDAQAALGGAGLNGAAVDGDRAPSDRLVSTVQSQDPAPGTEIGIDEAVRMRVYVSRQAARIRVPAVVGLGVDAARARLAEAGLAALAVNGDAAPSASAERTVQSQRPPAGSEIDPGGSVELRVFSARVPDAVVLRRIPNVVGMQVATAVRALGAAGFAAEEQRGPAAPRPGVEGTVQAQSPPAGAPAPAGARVAITVYTARTTGPVQHFVYVNVNEFTCCKEGNPPQAPHPVRLGPVTEWKPELRKLAGPFASADEARQWLCANHRVNPHYWERTWANVGGVTVTRVPCPITRP
jgi:beta-lactam-binding protein with PASTA domain